MVLEHARAPVVAAFGVFVVLVPAMKSQAQPAPDYAALLAAPDRSDADRQADKRRDPAPFLAFAGPHPMDRKLFAALKAGGFLVIADHSALPGQGTSVGKTLHRIEEGTLRKEVEASGFQLVAEGTFWRNPADTYDFPSYRPNMPVDNFVLKFQKPI